MEYKIEIVEDNIIISRKNKSRKCIFCGEHTFLNMRVKRKLNAQKLFYINFTNQIIICYDRMICSRCKRTFSEKNCSEIKKELQSDEIKKAILKEMFEKEILKYSELNERERQIFQGENINYKKYRVLERIAKPMNQFNKKMVKSTLLDLENWVIKKLEYKEENKKNYKIN